MSDIESKKMALDLVTKCRRLLGVSVDFEIIKKAAIIASEYAHEERRRGVRIAYDFYHEHKDSYENKKKAGNELAFIEGKISDECRLVGNAISGMNALTVSLKEKEFWEQVKIEIEELRCSMLGNIF